MQYWLLKSEPNTWSWDQQVKEGPSMWDGVRNYQARNNLKKMKRGDSCFFYHSVTEKTKKLKKVVLLNDIKKNKKLQNIALIKQSRLSVMPLKKLEWNIIIKMSSL